MSEIDRIASSYPARRPRGSLAAVERLRRALGLEEVLPAVVVVGTNGKTSTATYLQRLLGAAGIEAGLYVSPHLFSWAERVQIAGESCSSSELESTVAAAHECAQALGDVGELRFFDLLTVAAEEIFRRAGVRLGVFEAGIGGRLDAVSLLRPHLVLLTDLAMDHNDVLGHSMEAILTEKLLVAPAGALVLSQPLGDLSGTASKVSAAAGFSWRQITAGSAALPPGAEGLPGFQKRALALAAAGLSALGVTVPAPPTQIDLDVPGRFEWGERRGIPFLLDAAHNEAGWSRLATELRESEVSGPVTAVISLSAGKRREGLGEAIRSLPGATEVLVTRHSTMPATPPDPVAAELRAAGVQAHAVEDVGTALGRAFARARTAGGIVVVFGSLHLVGEAKGCLRGEVEGPTAVQE